jgi:hypothetical protein
VAKWGPWGYFPNYENLDVITRLVGHECAHLFYQEIFRKVGGVYAHPAIIEGEDADSRQIAAVIKLLDAVVHDAKAVIRPPTIAEAKQHYEESCAMSALLRGDMDDSCFDRADSETLHGAAMIYSKRGAEIVHLVNRSVRRPRHDPGQAFRAYSTVPVDSDSVAGLDLSPRIQATKRKS